MNKTRMITHGLTAIVGAAVYLVWGWQALLVAAAAMVVVAIVLGIVGRVLITGLMRRIERREKRLRALELIATAKVWDGLGDYKTSQACLEDSLKIMKEVLAEDEKRS